MPTTIKNEDGTETEVFSAEELSAQADEKVQAERERLESEHQVALEEQAAKLKEAEEALAKAKNKETNFGAIRRATEKRDEEEGKLKEEVESLRKVVDEVKVQPLVAAKTSFIKSNIGDNKEQLEVFNHFYDKLSVGASTVEDVNAAAVAAFNAMGVGRSAGSPMTRTGVSETFMNEGAGSESEESIAFGRQMKLTAEDKKKYGGMVSKTGVVMKFPGAQ